MSLLVKSLAWEAAVLLFLLTASSVLALLQDPGFSRRIRQGLPTPPRVPPS